MESDEIIEEIKIWARNRAIANATVWMHSDDLEKRYFEGCIETIRDLLNLIRKLNEKSKNETD